MLAAIVQHYRALFRYRALISFLVAAQRHGRVFKTLLGHTWFLVDPLAHMAIYYLLLVVVLRAGPRYGANPFLFIMMGLSHYFLIQRAVAYCSGAILSQRRTLVQIAIEPLVFPAVAFQRAVYDFAVFGGLFLLAYAVMAPQPSAALFLYPLLLALLACLAWALGIIVATASVFVRDAERASGIVLRLLLYASPVLYAADFVPEPYRNIYLYNPIATLFNLFHWVFFGTTPPGTAHVAAMLASILAIVVGAHLFYEWGRVRFAKAF